MIRQIIASALLAFLVMSQQALAYDYCQEGDDRIAVLIDQTTVYDASDREVIIGGLERIFKDLSPGTLVTVHTIVDAAANSKVAFSGCRPGCREQGLLGWFKSTCSAIRAKKEDQLYFGALARALRPILQAKIDYPRSDIVRTVRAASLKAQGRSVTKLVLYSDLLENSELIPYRKANYFADAASAKRRIETLGLLAELSNAEVVAFGFGRSHNNAEFGDYSSGRDGLDAALEARVSEFWHWYLRASGAKSVAMSRQYSD